MTIGIFFWNLVTKKIGQTDNWPRIGLSHWPKLHLAKVELAHVAYSRHNDTRPYVATLRGRPPGRRNVTTPACCGRSPQARAFCVAHWSRGPGRARGTRCSAFAESWGVIASAAERHDLTLMQPLHSVSAFTLSSGTLAVLDLHCEPK